MVEQGNDYIIGRAPRNGVAFEVAVRRNQANISVSVDGRQEMSWTDTGPGAVLGGGQVHQKQRSGSLLGGGGGLYVCGGGITPSAVVVMPLLSPFSERERIKRKEKREERERETEQARERKRVRERTKRMRENIIIPLPTHL